MQTSRSLQVVFLVTALVWCAGCTMTPRFTHAREAFPGVKHFYDQEDRSVSLLFIHGMGGFSSPNAGDKEDPQIAIEYLATELGLTLRTAETLTLEHAWRGHVLQWEFLRADETVAMRAYALHWKGTTKKITEALQKADNVPPLDCARPMATAKIKARMNDALGDVVLYAGPYGVTIQDTVIEAMIKVDANERAHASGRRTIIPVTWSLGSRILFDTLKRMHEDADCDCKELAQSVPVAFMLANQVQFLALASHPPSDDGTDGVAAAAADDGQPTSKMGQLLLPFEKAHAPDEKTYIVGVTDPSDLLSWPLPESKEGSSVVMINAYHAAAQSGFWIPVLGTLGNPYSAHTDYGADAQVLRWLLHGN
ncbi:MAG: hypothetical protein P1V36_07235, partial [Planctomycetota bacterium]|nr:hypothetical protein [Planctomycetota bacterium]